MEPNRQPPDYQNPHKTGILVNLNAWETVWSRPAAHFGTASLGRWGALPRS